MYDREGVLKLIASCVRHIERVYDGKLWPGVSDTFIDC
jgi:hypothetical protein